MNFRVVLAGLVACLVSAGAQAAVVYETDRVAFETANTINVSEDFEGLAVAPGSVLDIGTSATFGSLTFNVHPNPTTNYLLGMASGFAGISGITGIGLAPNTFVDNLEIVSALPLFAFGLDVMSDNDGTSTSISLFDASDALIASTSIVVGQSVATFFGVTSTVGIARILLDNGADGGPIVDNVVASSVPAVPLPASALLLLTGFGGILGASRAKRRQSA